MFTLEDAECLALCGNAPCVTVNWRFFGDVDLERFDALIDDLRAGRLDDEVPPHGTLNRVRRTSGSRRRAGRRRRHRPDGRRRRPSARPRRLPPDRRSRHPPDHARWPPWTPPTSEAGRDYHRRAPHRQRPARPAPVVDAQSYLDDGGYQGLRAALAMTPEGRSTTRSTRPTSWAGAAPASKPGASGGCSARPSLST